MYENITCTIKAFMRPEKFEQCLERVIEAGLKTIVIGYDGPKNLSEKHKQIVSKYSSNEIVIKFIELPFNTGLAKTRNIINSQANTKYILQLDDDIYVPTNICSLAKFLERHSDYGVISPGWIESERGLPSLNACDLEIKNEYLFRTFHLPKLMETYSDITALFPFDFVPTNGMYRMEMFQDVQWDKKFKIWGEHQDFFLTSKHLGKWKNAICTSLYVVHDSCGGPEFSAYRYGKEQIDSFNYLMNKWQIKGIYPRGIDATLFDGNVQFDASRKSNDYKLYLLEKGKIRQRDIQVIDNGEMKWEIEKMNSFKDVHKDKRCIVIGTGPSLNKTDFSLVKNEIIFGVNTLYRGFKTFGINPKYMCCSDSRIWNVHDESLLQLDSTLFLTGGAKDMYLQRLDNYQFEFEPPIIIPTIGQMWNAKRFQTDVTKGLYNGDTIIIDVALQMAYWMGFSQVLLIGCDCDYSGIHRWDGLKSEGSESPPCQGNWSRVFKSYEICKEAYENDRREIINCTTGGKLEIFPRKKLEDII